MTQLRAMIAALLNGRAKTSGCMSARAQGPTDRSAWRTWGRPVGTKPDPTEPWYGEYPPAGVEPPLAEVLSDPIVHLVMRADHLVPGEVLSVLTPEQR